MLYKQVCARLCIRIIRSRQRTARAIHAECTVACKITLSLSCCPYILPRPNIESCFDYASIDKPSSQHGSATGVTAATRTECASSVCQSGLMMKLRQKRRAQQFGRATAGLMFCNNAGLYYGAKHSARLVRRGILAPTPG